MESKPPTSPESSDELESLDETSTVVESSTDKSSEAGAGDDDDVVSAEGSTTPTPVAAAPQSLRKRITNRILSFNIYLLLFVFILAITAAIIFLTYNYSRTKSGDTQVDTTTLSQDTLDKLANSDVTVGNTSQVLSVQSSAVFAGKVLTRSDLEVAGNLQIGGSLNLRNLNVNDNANLGDVAVSKNLSVTGNAAIQGQQTIGGGLQVAGSGRFNGTLSAPQISTNSLQLNGDLVLTRHLTAGGGTPSRTSGSALGSGGSVSISGSDTAGSVSINTGGGPGAGCFVTVTFTRRYDATPHVIVTPVGSAASTVAYYVNRSSSNFSICTSNAAPSNANFGFDYFVAG